MFNSGNRYVLQSASVDPSGLNLTTALTFDTLGSLTEINGPRSDVSDLTNFAWDANRRLRMRIEADPDGAGALPRPAERVTYNLDGAVKRCTALADERLPKPKILHPRHLRAWPPMRKSRPYGSVRGGVE